VWLAVVAALAATALAVSAVVGAALDDTPGSFPGRLPSWLILIGLASLAMLVVASWLIAAPRPIASIGLATIVAGIALPIGAALSGVASSLHAPLVALAPLAVAGVVLVGLGWLPQGASLRWVVAPLALVAASIVVTFIAYNPFADPGCVLTCEASATLAADMLSTRADVTLSAVLVVLATLVAGVGLLRASRGRRLVTTGVLVGLVALAVGWMVRVARWEDQPSPTLVALPPIIVAAATGLTAFVAAIRERRTRDEVRRVVDGLARTGSIGGPGTIRDVQFAMSDGGRWVDEHGNDAGEVSDGRTIVITDGGVPAVRLVVGSGVDDETVLVALTPATRLTLRNARLAALARARLGEVQASRRRIIAVSDAERERIERDLHDGAQQRLVAASLHLNVALNRGMDASAGPAQADQLVRLALSNLRQLAHGIFPASLSTHGLVAALEELVAASDGVVRLEVEDLHLPPDTALGAYAVAAAALDAAARSGLPEVALRVVEGDGEIAVDVDLPGGSFPEDTFIHVTDRVAALGGTLTASRADGVVNVRARLPCAS
jgi:signal transduction histidine kinase